MSNEDGFFHVVLSTDSLSLPRPWNAKKISEDPEQHFRYRDTYPYLLQIKLRVALPHAEVQVSNMGQRASSIGGASVKRMDILHYMEPSACVIHHGVVDCWIRPAEEKRFRVPLDEYEKHVQLILDARGQYAPALPVIFIGIMPTNAAMLAKQPEQNEIIAQYNASLRARCKGQAVFLDVEKLFGHMTEQVVHLDGHHISRLGHKLYADELFRLLMLSVLS